MKRGVIISGDRQRDLVAQRGHVGQFLRSCPGCSGTRHLGTLCDLGLLSPMVVMSLPALHIEDIRSENCCSKSV